MNRSVLNRTLLNTSVLCQSRLNQSGLASLCGKSGGIPSAIRRAMVLWYDIARQGCTNENMAENPILKDLSGNGYDARCYNFAWEGMSGVGGYAVRVFLGGNFNLSTGKATIINKSKVHITHTPIGDDPMYSIYEYRVPTNTIIQSTKIKVSGLNNNFIIKGRANNPFVDVLIDKDGIYELPSINNTSNNTMYPGLIVEPADIDCDITIELLPEYPNALVSDGVDDYCLAPTIPSLDSSQGFTIIAKREAWEDGTSYAALASKMTDASETMGAFIIERINSTGEGTHINVFGSNTPISHGKKSGVMYCTSKNYNGETALTSGGNPDSNSLVLFKFDCSETAQYCGRYALYSFMLFDRDLTEDEINWVKTNLITV